MFFELIGGIMVALSVVPISLFFFMSITGFGQKSRLYKYCFNVSVSWDQTLNALLLGYPDETISSRAGKGRRAGKWYWTLVANVLDFIDKDHSENAIEDDEGRPTPPKRKLTPKRRIAIARRSKLSK